MSVVPTSLPASATPGRAAPLWCPAEVHTPPPRPATATSAVQMPGGRREVLRNEPQASQEPAPERCGSLFD